ncbi:MAG: hypothetical protein A2X46_08795 [Lentisphaerae bacterium GWF2_57_35]|nr:MAG: hypothetical protein A2X46_08795 [Lentisphaerae bacterium GWF2_57_35]
MRPQLILRSAEKLFMTPSKAWHGVSTPAIFLFRQFPMEIAWNLFIQITVIVVTDFLIMPE